jgi:hypothetical protein
MPSCFGRARRDHSPFIGCVGYPQCRYTAPYDEAIQQLAERLARHESGLLWRPHTPHLPADYVARSSVDRALRHLAAVAHPDRWQGHAVAEELTKLVLDLREQVVEGQL